jgi:hypothetical protein
MKNRVKERFFLALVFLLLNVASFRLHTKNGVDVTGHAGFKFSQNRNIGFGTLCIFLLGKISDFIRLA